MRFSLEWLEGRERSEENAIVWKEHFSGRNYSPSSINAKLAAVNKLFRFLDESAAKDSRIRLIRPGGAFSLPAKLNRCLEQAQGLSIARMDDDGYSHPERFFLVRSFSVTFAERPSMALMKLSSYSLAKRASRFTSYSATRSRNSTQI